MRINTNITALNSHRMLQTSSAFSAKNLEKLSSGKRINKAADDAAGLAISEKMNAQIRGLKMASRNSLDGVSLVQTAEGAMGEIHSMLQRMRELSVQAANGTLSSEDRGAIQDEVNQLTSEINRIGNGTEFNKLNILKGNQGPDSNTIINTMSTGQPAQINMDAIAPGTPAAPFIKLAATDSISVVVNSKETIINTQGFSTDPLATLSYSDFLERVNDALGDDATAYFNDNGSMLVKTNKAGGSQSIEFKGAAITSLLSGPTSVYGTAENPAAKSSGVIYFSKVPEKGSYITISDKRIDFYDSSKEPYTGTNIPVDINAKTAATLVTELRGLTIEGVRLAGVPDPDDAANPLSNSAALKIEALNVGFSGNVITLEGTLKEFNVNLQVGGNTGQGFRLEVGDVRALSLKISAEKPTGNPGVAGAAYCEIPNVTNGIDPSFVQYALDVSSEEKATAAIEVYNNAVISLASERSKLGAIQNRLEKTIANLDNTAENLTAAKSRIEDTDMALEMSEFTKYNIIQQAGTAMLAQANQQPQMMLKLLNG